MGAGADLEGGVGEIRESGDRVPQKLKHFSRIRFFAPLHRFM